MASGASYQDDTPGNGHILWNTCAWFVGLVFVALPFCIAMFHTYLNQVSSNASQTGSGASIFMVNFGDFLFIAVALGAAGVVEFVSLLGNHRRQLSTFPLFPFFLMFGLLVGLILCIVGIGIYSEHKMVIMEKYEEISWMKEVGIMIVSSTTLVSLVLHIQLKKITM